MDTGAPMYCSKGSLWRKWDLHVHTPSSFDYKNKSISNQQIIDALVHNGIRLVAITDHHTIDVERIRALQELGHGKITVLPGIELRSELGGSETVHYIGIFPEDCDLNHIWGKLKNQLNLTKKDIKERGGDHHIYVPIREAAKLIHQWGVVSVHAGGKQNSLENISNKTLFQRAIKTDLIKDGVIDILEIGVPGDVNDYQTIVFPKIEEYLPLIICSDNHRITDYELKANCWFRADPSFFGLLQVLVEPQDRIFIGEKPQKRVSVSKNHTRYIKSIAIQKKVTSDLDDVWFDDISLDLNHDLIAIIGNKGTGKSALAEIIGLLGNTHNDKSFSFLSSERFRNPQSRLAEHFSATITWENDDQRKVNLNDMANLNAPESIQFIPQGLFEDICNEVASGDDNKFNQELRKVIFSHVPVADQLGKESLDDLLTHLTDEIEQSITILKGQLNDINVQIADLEKQLTSGFRDKLNYQIQEKRSELDSHDKRKPDAEPQPTTRTDENSEISTRLSQLETKRVKLESRIKEAQSQESDSAKLSATASKVLGALTNLESQFQEIKKQITPDLDKLDIHFDEVATLTVNRKPVTTKQSLHQSRRTEAAKLINAKEPKSLVKQLESCTKETISLQKRLDEPSQRYEAYRTSLREWNEQREHLTGSADIVGSLYYLEQQLKRLDGVPTKLKKLKQSRLELTEKIYRKIEALVKEYRKFYSPVQQFSELNDVSKDSFDLKFDVSIVDQGLEENFFDWIGQGTSGSFYGATDGPKTLKRIVESRDFNQWEGVKAFLSDLDEHLNLDKRQENKPVVQVSNQLRKGKDLEAFYSFIYSLDYLRPRYVLKLDEKELSQLSPGERGALLLIFYLLIDKAVMPLIIDQPEENLDNQTVYTHLVRAIKQAKNRRQIIIVTHNPNLAVVCDAEQVVCCSIDKKDGHRIEYTTGAIENPNINEKIVDILEGTQPALTNRWRKYSPFRETILK